MVKEFKILYPYGLNDKCGNHYYSEYNKDKLVYSIFDTQGIKRKQRGKGKGRHVDISNDVETFSKRLLILIKKNKNWRHFCYKFLIECSLKVLNVFKLEVAHSINNYSKNASDFISDLINQRLRLKTKPTRSQFMRIYFDNKGIEMVNISRLLH